MWKRTHILQLYMEEEAGINRKILPQKVLLEQSLLKEDSEVKRQVQTESTVRMEDNQYKVKKER